MGIIIRQSFKSTIFLYFGILIGVINRLFLLPYYLTFEQLALLDLLIALATIISEISLLGLKGSLQKFFSLFENKKKLATLTGISITIPLLFLIIFSIIIILLKGPIVNLFPKNKILFEEYFIYIIPFSFFMMYKGLFTVYAANKMRLTIPTILNEVFSKISVLISLILISISIINFSNYVFLMCLSYFIIAISLFIYCKYTLKMKMSFHFNNLSSSIKKEISSYSLFVLLMGLSNLISQYTDSIMLARLEGFNTAGIYSIAFFIGLSIEMPKRAISSISGAVIAKHWNNNEVKEIDKLYKQSSINQGIIGGLLLVLVIINIDELFYLLPKSEALSVGKNVAIIIGVSRFIDMITGVNNEILRTSKYYKLDFYMIVFFIILSISLNYILIPLYNIHGAAYATLISVTLYNLIRYILLKKLFNFNPFNIKTLVLLALIGFLLTINQIIPPIQFESKIWAVLLIGIKSIVYGYIFVYTIYILNVSIEVNGLINKLISKIRT